MNSASFDSHQYIKHLRDSGVRAPEAEAIAAIAAELAAFSPQVAAAVQARELTILKESIKDMFARYAAATDAKIAAAKNETIKWMFGFFIAQVSGTFALIKAFV